VPGRPGIAVHALVDELNRAMCCAGTPPTEVKSPPANRNEVAGVVPERAARHRTRASHVAPAAHAVPFQIARLPTGMPLAWVNLGIALGAAGDTTGAISALNRAATLDPSEPLAWFNLGNIMLVRGDLAGASAMYEKTAVLDPSITLAHFQLARVNLLRKEYRAALTTLRRGLAFESSDASARAMASQLAQRLRAER